MIRRPPGSTRTDTLFPYTTLFRSSHISFPEELAACRGVHWPRPGSAREWGGWRHAMGLTALGRVDKFEHVGKWPVQDIPLPQSGGARGGRDPGLDPGELLAWRLQTNEIGRTPG